MILEAARKRRLDHPIALNRALDIFCEHSIQQDTELALSRLVDALGLEIWDGI